MITTRRLTNSSTGSFVQQGGDSNVAVLERKQAKSFNEYVAPKQEQESLVEARERMQKNLDKLLNYDRYAEITKEEEQEAVAMEVASESVAVVNAVSEEDIRPTSTTMQFGDEDAEQIYNDMRRGSSERESYHLNSKGKLIVVLYALAVTIIMALIILNTGILAGLKNNQTVLSEKAQSLSVRNTQIREEIEEKSNDQYVLEQAEKLDTIE